MLIHRIIGTFIVIAKLLLFFFQDDILKQELSIQK